MNGARPLGRPPGQPLGYSPGGSHGGGGPVCIAPTVVGDPLELPWVQGFTSGVGTIVAPDDAVGFSRGEDTLIAPFGDIDIDSARFYDDFDEFTICNVGIFKHCRIVTITPLAPEVTGMLLEVMDDCSSVIETSVFLTRDEVDENLFEAIGGKGVMGLVDGVHRYFRLTAIEA